MSTTRGEAADHVHMASPAAAKGARVFSVSDAARGVACRELEVDKASGNPLLDDLPPDSCEGGSEAEDQNVLLQENSIINSSSITETPKMSPLLSDDTVTNGLNTTRVQQIRVAVDIICNVSQRFVHAMQMYNMDDYFSPSNGESAEDALRRQLGKKDRQEVDAVVLALVELLEDARKARGHAEPFIETLSLLGGSRSRCISRESLFSTVSTASLFRLPVQETHQVATAYDQHGHRTINRYTVIAELGRGAFGQVKLGADTSTGQMVAIKIINKKNLKKIRGFGSEDQEEALKREIAIMKKVRHRNCVSLYEVIDDPDSRRLYLIMEYVPNGPVVRLKTQQLNGAALETVEAGVPLNGELYCKFLIRCAVRQSPEDGTARLTDSEMRSNPTVFICRPLSQHICSLYLRQLVSGLRYMHKRHLVHHDIKPDNILVGTDHHVFLSDFGVSEILTNLEVKQAVKKSFESIDECSVTESPCASCDSDSSSLDSKDNVTEFRARLGAGTLLFTAPELLDESVNHLSVDPYLTDIWALGVTLYCMLVGISPFFGNTYAQVRSSILWQTFPWCGQTIYEAPLAAEWLVVLNGLLAKDPSKRWSLLRLKSYIEQKDFQSVMQQSLLREASLRSGSSVFQAHEMQISPTMRANSGSLSQPLDVAPPKMLRPSFALGPIANGLPCPYSNPSPSFPAPAMDLGVTARGFVWDMGISEQEVRDATRMMKVEVRRRKTIVSMHTRSVVHRYVESVRASMRDRHFIKLGSSLPDSSSQSNTQSPTRMPAVSHQKSEAGYVAHVPQLAGTKAGPPSEGGPISASSLFYPKRRSSQPQGHISESERLSEDRCIDGTTDLAHRAFACNSHSLDALLSIVNLSSTSQDQSVSSSMTSSTVSSVSVSTQRSSDGNRTGRVAENSDHATTSRSPGFRHMRISGGAKGSTAFSRLELPLGVPKAMSSTVETRSFDGGDRLRQVTSLPPKGIPHKDTHSRNTSSDTVSIDDEAAHRSPTPTSKLPSVLSMPSELTRYSSTVDFGSRSPSGCHTTSLDPKTLNINGFPALSSDKPLPVRSQDSNSNTPGKAQQRLSEMKYSLSSVGCADGAHRPINASTVESDSPATYSGARSSDVVRN